MVISPPFSNIQLGHIYNLKCPELAHWTHFLVCLESKVSLDKCVFQTMIPESRYQPESSRASNLLLDQVKNSCISWPSCPTVGKIECPVQMFKHLLLTPKRAFIVFDFIKISHLLTLKFRWCPHDSLKCLGSALLMKKKMQCVLCASAFCIFGGAFHNHK